MLPDYGPDAANATPSALESSKSTQKGVVPFWDCMAYWTLANIQCMAILCCPQRYISCLSYKLQILGTSFERTAAALSHYSIVIMYSKMHINTPRFQNALYHVTVWLSQLCVQYY